MEGTQGICAAGRFRAICQTWHSVFSRWALPCLQSLRNNNNDPDHNNNSNLCRLPQLWQPSFLLAQIILVMKTSSDEFSSASFAQMTLTLAQMQTAVAEGGFQGLLVPF